MNFVDVTILNFGKKKDAKRETNNEFFAHHTHTFRFGSIDIRFFVFWIFWILNKILSGLINCDKNKQKRNVRKISMKIEETVPGTKKLNRKQWMKWKTIHSRIIWLNYYNYYANFCLKKKI